MNVSKVIYDALARRQSVVLPGVGSLEVKRRKARRISDTEIQPPANVGVFSEGELEGASSVVSMLARQGISPDEAWNTYNSWLEGARREDGSVVIDGVGEIRDGHFEGYTELAAMLNPAGEEDTLAMKKRGKKGGKEWIWLLSAILFMVLLFCALWCWKNGVFDAATADRANAETDAVAEAVADESVIEEPVVSEPEKVTVDKPVVAPAVTTTSGPMYHVIAGSFRIESNADKLVKKVKAEHPELTPRKFVDPRTGYNMVSIYSAPTEREAYNTMNKYFDVDLYLWVYRITI